MTTPSQTRRSFLRLAGAGAAASLMSAGSVWPRGDAPPVAPKKQKPPFALGLASYSLRKFKLDETLAMTRRVGLTHICFKSMHLELKSSPEEIAVALAKVKAAGLTLYGGGVIQLRNPKQIDQAFAYAKAAGMTTIVGVPGPDVLTLVNDKIKATGIGVAIHNHGPGDKLFPTPESAYRRIEKLDKRFGLCIDIGHTVRIGADPVKDVERFADRLLDMHLKDVSEASPKGRCVEAGRGVIDLPGVLAALLKIRYSRVASFEYEKDPDDPLAGLAESVGYVRGILAALE